MSPNHSSNDRNGTKTPSRGENLGAFSSMFVYVFESSNFV